MNNKIWLSVHPGNTWLWPIRLSLRPPFMLAHVIIRACEISHLLHTNSCSWRVFQVLCRPVICFQMITGSGRFFFRRNSVFVVLMAKVGYLQKEINFLIFYLQYIFRCHHTCTLVTIPIFPTFMVSHWFSYSYRSVNFDNTAMLSSRKIHRCCWDRY